MPDKPQDKYPRITRAQFDLWAANPVTKTFMQCVEWGRADINDLILSGTFVSAENNDLTCSNLHRLSGYREAMTDMSRTEKLLQKYEMLEAEDA